MRPVVQTAVLVLAASVGWQAAAEEARVEVRIDLRDAGEWVEAPPNQVFAQGDKIRFRFQANFDGYLYVMNHESGGGYTMLFPREELEGGNEVRSGEEYTIPGSGAWFQVDGPPGYDVTLWLVAPTDLGRKVDWNSFSDLPSTPGREAPPGDLLPRCDDKHLRTKGVCVDPKAGPQPLARSARLPAELDDLSARDLRIEREGQGTRIYPKSSPGKPVIYEFRLAHK